MILDWLFGDPHTSMHPVAVFGRFAMAVEKKWRRYGNGIRQGVAAWGCAVIPVTVITGMAVWCVMRWGGESAAAVVAGAVVYFAIALRSLNDHAMIIEKALRKFIERQKCGCDESTEDAQQLSLFSDEETLSYSFTRQVTSRLMDNLGVINDCVRNEGNLEAIIDRPSEKIKKHSERSKGCSQRILQPSGT